ARGIEILYRALHTPYQGLASSASTIGGHVAGGELFSHRLPVVRRPSVRARDGAGAEVLRNLGSVNEIHVHEPFKLALQAPDLAEHLRRAAVERGGEPFFG